MRFAIDTETRVGFWYTVTATPQGIQLAQA